MSSGETVTVRRSGAWRSPPGLLGKLHAEGRRVGLGPLRAEENDGLKDIVDDPLHGAGDGIPLPLRRRADGAERMPTVRVSGGMGRPGSRVSAPVRQADETTLRLGGGEVLAAGEPGGGLRPRAWRAAHGLDGACLAALQDADVGAVARGLAPVVGHPQHRAGEPIQTRLPAPAPAGTSGSCPARKRARPAGSPWGSDARIRARAVSAAAGRRRAAGAAGIRHILQPEAAEQLLRLPRSRSGLVPDGDGNVLPHGHIGKQGVLLEEVPHPAAAGAAGRSCRRCQTASSPSRAIRPSSGVRMPAIHRRVTLLPQPEAPSRARGSRPGLKVGLQAGSSPASCGCPPAGSSLPPPSGSGAAAVLQQVHRQQEHGGDGHVHQHPAAWPRRRRWCARAGRRWWRWWRSGRGCSRPSWRWRRTRPGPGQRPAPCPPGCPGGSRASAPARKSRCWSRPRVRPASDRVSSKLSKAPRAVRYIRGKATTTVAKMADHQVMTSRTPNVSRTQAPMRPLGPQQPQQKIAHHRGRQHQGQRQHHVQHALDQPGQLGDVVGRSRCPGKR